MSAGGGYVTPRRAAEIRAEIEAEIGGPIPLGRVDYPQTPVPIRRPSVARERTNAPRAEREDHLALFDLPGADTGR